MRWAGFIAYRVRSKEAAQVVRNGSPQGKNQGFLGVGTNGTKASELSKRPFFQRQTVETSLVPL
jgi:hypothetical protein